MHQLDGVYEMPWTLSTCPVLGATAMQHPNYRFYDIDVLFLSLFFKSHIGLQWDWYC